MLSLPRLVFTALYTAISAMLMVRSGLLSFAHDHIRKAVERKYLPTNELKRKYFMMVAQYFEEGNGSYDLPRKCQELPWCLSHSGQAYRLARCLSNISVFYELYTKQNKFEFKRYWLQIIKDYDIAQVYSGSLEEYSKEHENTSDQLDRVSQLFSSIT
jgi:hypothetical protein